MAIVKGMVVGGILAALATGSYFVATSLSYAPVAVRDSSADKGEYDNKIGKDYEYFLVAPFEEHNRSWWAESYKRWREDRDKTSGTGKFGEEFKDNTKVTQGFGPKDGPDSATSINGICHSIYKRAKTDIEGESHRALRADLFRYCSVLEGIPKTIKEAGETGNYSSDEGSIGKEREEELAAVGANEVWWKTKTREFHERSEPSEEFFKRFHKDEKGKSVKRSLRERCGEAYGKQSTGSGEETTTVEETLVHCSLDRK